MPSITPYLAGLKGGAAGLSALTGAVACDVDALGCAAAVFVINALDGVALHFQAGLRCLEQVGKRSALVLVKAGAASLVGLNGLIAVHQNQIGRASCRERV